VITSPPPPPPSLAFGPAAFVCLDLFAFSANDDAPCCHSSSRTQHGRASRHLARNVVARPGYARRVREVSDAP